MQSGLGNPAAAKKISRALLVTVSLVFFVTVYCQRGKAEGWGENF
jgi:hypothetical protein